MTLPPAGAVPEPPGPDAGFNDRLNWLFATVHPASGPYSSSHVVRVIKENPGKYGEVSLTESYLSALRKGKRSTPNTALCRALAGFFGVPVGYLVGDLDPAKAKDVEDEVQLLALALRDKNVQMIALRSLGLRREAQSLVLGLLGELGGGPRLPGGPADDPAPPVETVAPADAAHAADAAGDDR